jgi:hypothetical protein
MRKTFQMKQKAASFDGMAILRASIPLSRLAMAPYVTVVVEEE